MKTRKPSDILSEHLFLNPPESSPKSTGLLIDRVLGPNVILRIYQDTFELHYLDSSRIIRIPGIWVRIWRDLDRTSGEELLMTDMTGLGRLDLFVLGFLRFVRLLETTSDQNSEALEILWTLLHMGTSEIIRFLKDTINLDPWEIEEINNTHSI